MTSFLLTHSISAESIPLVAVTADKYKNWLKKQGVVVKKWIEAHHFDPKAGQFIRVPSEKGGVAQVLVCVSDPISLWDLAALPTALQSGFYVLQGSFKAEDEEKLALGWQLGVYRFSLYKKNKEPSAKLCLSKKVSLPRLRDLAESLCATRDLISTPAEDMDPAALAAAAKAVAKKFGAKCTVLVGSDLLKKNYPAIYTVGRASPNAPRLIDLTWGNPKHPRLTLVGKGVCFDTGGLDLKPSSNMYLMRKDMGGGAVALGLARMIMARKLPVRLRVLIPAVENATDGKSFRPSDVLTMRNGATVEVGNTDAEGRLVLADALCEAAREKPEMILDFATLTGAARVAVGTEISAFFVNDDRLAADIQAASVATQDPMWRLPLHEGYESMLASSFADMNSAPSSGYAGAITAALFLQRFVPKGQRWAHVDFMAWNTSSRAGRPEGGEAMALRAILAMLEKRFLKN